MSDRIGIRKAGNAGLVAGGSPAVTTTGGNDLLHIPGQMTVQTVTFPARTFIIRKIMWYNNTGANATLRIGTLNGTPAFVDMLPTIYAPNLFDGELTEDELPGVEFIAAAPLAVAAVRFNGNAYVLASIAGVLVAIEVEEFGA